MKILPFGLRGLAITGAIVLLVGIAGAGAASSDTSALTNPQSFFQNVGGSPWANVQTQYCAYALPGSTNCAGGGGFVTNPKGQLKGVWTDPTPVPDDIVTLGLAQNLVDDPIASEAVRAA